MKIRNMKHEDYQEVDRLMAQVHKIHVDGRPDLYVDVEHIYSLDAYQKMIENNDMISVVAEENEKIVGICFVSMRTRTCMVNRRTAYMDDLCVDETCRGKGVGKFLYEYAKKRAKEMGAERLDLMVWSFNEHALKFYEEMGLKPQRYIMEEHL